MITGGRLIIVNRARTFGAWITRSVSVLAALVFGTVSVAAPPSEFSNLYSGQSCAGCHSPPGSLPPRLPADGSSIVPNGAVASSGTELRSIMTARRTMGTILTPNNGLTDDVLNKIRLYLVDVRDGAIASAVGSNTEFGNSTVFVEGSVQRFTITNERGIDATFVSPPSGSNDEFFKVEGGSCLSSTTLAANGGSCTVHMQFKPTGTGPRKGSVHFKFNSPSGVTTMERSLDLTGTGVAAPVLDVFPATSPAKRFQFTSHIGVASKTATWTLTNIGGGTITLGSIANETAGYLIDSASTCTSGFVLPTTATSCTLILSFKPSIVDVVDAQVLIEHSIAGSPAPIYLRGTGTGDPLLQLGAVTPVFPMTLVGHPVSGTVTVTNSGTAIASLGKVGIVPVGPFTQTNGCDSTQVAKDGGTCAINVTFSPITASDNQSATLTVPYATSLSTQRTIIASAKQLAFVPTALSAMQAARGASATTTIDISNPSGISTFLAPISLNNPVNFTITSNNCTTMLAPTSRCSIGIKFTPNSDLFVSAALTVSYGPSAGQNTSQSIRLTIDGSTQLMPLVNIVPTSLNFPATLLGQKSSLFVDIGNAGSAALNLTSIVLADNVPADFSIVGNTCSTSIAVGSSTCRVTVTFTPSTQLPRTTRLVITHNAAGGSTDVPLFGTTLLQPVASLSPTTLDFASVLVASGSPLLSAVLTNTGSKDLRLGIVSVIGANATEFSQVGSTCPERGVVAPAASCRFTLRFTPSAPGSRNATLQINHDADASPSNVTLAGIGVSAPAPDIQTNETAIVFTPTVVRTASTPQSITVRNSGTADLLFSRIASSGTAAADFAPAGTCTVGTPLRPDATCTVSVTFTPDNVGTRNAQLSIESNAGRGAVTIALRGIALAVPAPAVSLSSDGVNFGPQTVGGLYPPTTIRLQNTGTAVLHIASIVASGPGFTASGNCGATLVEGASCEINVAFVPTSAGAIYSGQITINSDASGAPHVVPLSGQGTAAAVPVVTWSPVVTALAFGDVATGNGSPVQSVQLLNQGPGGVVLNVVNAVGTNAADFSLTGTCIPGSVLLQGATCRIDVTFVPGSAGAKKASIQVASTGTPPPDVQLAGNGLGGPAPGLAVSTTALSFDITRVGAQSLPFEIRLTNTGSGTTRITAMDVVGPYSMQSKTCPNVPFTLPTGSECTVTVTFLPQTEGIAAGILRVNTDAAPSVREVALNGTAEAKADVTGGGCSIASGDSLADPTLWMLVLLAIAALLYRHQTRRAMQQRRDATRRSGP